MQRKKRQALRHRHEVLHRQRGDDRAGDDDNENDVDDDCEGDDDNDNDVDDDDDNYDRAGWLGDVQCWNYN